MLVFFCSWLWSLAGAFPLFISNWLKKILLSFFPRFLAIFFFSALSGVLWNYSSRFLHSFSSQGTDQLLPSTRRLKHASLSPAPPLRHPWGEWLHFLNVTWHLTFYCIQHCSFLFVFLFSLSSLLTLCTASMLFGSSGSISLRAWYSSPALSKFIAAPCVIHSPKNGRNGCNFRHSK